MKINKSIIQHIIYALVFLWFMGNPTQGHTFGPLGYMSHYFHKPLKGHVMSVTQVTPVISRGGSRNLRRGILLKNFW